MRKKKVTMLDIATAVGVSQPTVSVILNGSNSIKVSEQTREKVLNKARELGYQYNTKIQHTNHHQRIALIVNSINMHDPFINAITSAKVQAWESDALLVVFDYEDDDELKEAMLEEISHGSYQGLIYASNTPKNVDYLPDVSIPFVYLNCHNDTLDNPIPMIITADYLGGYHAAEHLIKKGYQRLGMILGEEWADPSINRFKGFRQALINYDIPFNKEWVVAGNWSVKQSYQATENLLNQDKRPDAIFCASDLMALGCYQAIHAAQLRIPEDIAVIGYDNQLLANELTPSLTSIDLPYDEMGRQAVDIILSDQAPEIMRIKVEGDLYPRQST